MEYGSKQLAGLIGAPLYQVDSVMLIIAGSAIFCFTAVGLAGILLPQKCLLGLVSIWGFPQIIMWWLSGRVLDSGSRGCRFESHVRRCIVSLSKAYYTLLSTGSTQEDPSQHD